jgi:GNAT superfamily N-acetyltransferase
MALIRLMSPTDLESVAHLDALAFHTQPRTPQHLQASLAMNLQGCFVALSELGIPVGYIFSRQWGNLGWIGVGGVHPNHRQQGLGKSLFRQAVHQLKSVGCTAIGCSTQTTKNIGTWGSLGFSPGPPTLEMVKPTIASEPQLTHALLQQIDRTRALQAIQQISYQVQPGLDYTPEVINAAEYDWGETLLFGWPSPWGFALLRTKPIRVENNDSLRIAVLAISDTNQQCLPAVLKTLECQARKWHFNKLQLFVDSSADDAFQCSLKLGFKVQGVWIRMALNQSTFVSSGINMSLWAM